MQSETNNNQNQSNMKEFSPYKVTWVELIPNTGIVTKHDRKIFGEFRPSGKERTHRKHFPSKEDAISWIKNFDASRLDKSYTCYLFTDKQFSLAKAENGFAIPYTTKQRNTPYTLGK